MPIVRSVKAIETYRLQLHKQCCGSPWSLASARYIATNIIYHWLARWASAARDHQSSTTLFICKPITCRAQLRTRRRHASWIMASPPSEYDRSFTVATDQSPSGTDPSVLFGPHRQTNVGRICLSALPLGSAPSIGKRSIAMSMFVRL